MTLDPSHRSLATAVRRDLGRKLVVLTGARQSGKTTLAKQLMIDFEPAQYLNWDVPADRSLIADHAWSPKARLLVFDEIHKMKEWKSFLKGAWDGRSPEQAMLVTGSARMDTFRQGGESLAGRYYNWRLHPFSVRELVETQGLSAEQALARLLERGGFPEPCLADSAVDADRWRAQYSTDLIREDVLDFSRVHEVRTLQLMFTMLRERVGSPIKVSSLAQALQISPTTAARYLDILEALYIVFRVTPWHRDVSRSLLKEAKVYFLDAGLVIGDAGARLENAVAAMLLKHCHHRQDAEGKPVALHTIRDKEHHEIDFVLAEGDAITDLIEVKLSDPVPSAYLHRMAERFAPARAVQVVDELRQPAQRGRVEVVEAAGWLAELAA
ncbi:MAG: ATP-binding protein [Burkholderiaceae bacterium]|nr:ATP-binding protein [Burkholderiaceae bacterium]